MKQIHTCASMRRRIKWNMVRISSWTSLCGMRVPRATGCGIPNILASRVLPY